MKGLGQVSVAVGTGRCGTTFLARLASREPGVAASHERQRLAATFHMFCQWHGIAADSEGFLVGRDTAVAEDLREHQVSFESSALLSHSILALYERYDARFLLLVRRPDETVASFAARGWFLDAIPWQDQSLPPTIPDGANPRHFFGRNLPRGKEFERWSQLSQVGKLAWFWRARNGAILRQFAKIPATHSQILRLEDFDHQGYASAAEFLGWQSRVTSEQFADLASSRPNAGPNPPKKPTGWSSAAIQEFEAELGDLAQALGYEHRVSELLGGGSALLGPAPEVSAALKALG